MKTFKKILFCVLIMSFASPAFGQEQLRLVISEDKTTDDKYAVLKSSLLDGVYKFELCSSEKNLAAPGAGTLALENCQAIGRPDGYKAVQLKDRLASLKEQAQDENILNGYKIVLSVVTGYVISGIAAAEALKIEGQRLPWAVFHIAGSLGGTAGLGVSFLFLVDDTSQEAEKLLKSSANGQRTSGGVVLQIPGSSLAQIASDLNLLLISLENESLSEE